MELPKNGFLRINEVLKFVPIGKSTLWAWVRGGRFPKPVKLSQTVTAWKAEDIQAYLDAPDGGWRANTQNETLSAAN